MPAKKKDEEVAEEVVEETPQHELPTEDRIPTLYDNGEPGFQQTDGHGWSDEELAAREESAAK